MYNAGMKTFRIVYAVFLFIFPTLFLWTLFSLSQYTRELVFVISPMFIIFGACLSFYFLAIITQYE